MRMQSILFSHGLLLLAILGISCDSRLALLDVGRTMIGSSGRLVVSMNED